MCECMKVLKEQFYVLPNLLGKDFFIPATNNGKVLKSPYLQVRYCPNCGEKQVKE